MPISRATVPATLGIGLGAGIVSGLLGVGGGIVMVPLLVLFAGLGQHQAHATSLAAVIPIATVGSATYAIDGSVEFGIAVWIAAGALIGAPLGARLMSKLDEGTLKILFGAIGIGMGVFLAWP